MKKQKEKRLILLSLLMMAFCLSAGSNVGSCIPALGGWQEGASGSTHQVWDFSSATPWYPVDVYNPYGMDIGLQPLAGIASFSNGLLVSTGSTMSIDIRIPNNPEINAYKEIWIDLGLSPDYQVDAVILAAIPPSGTVLYQSDLLDPLPGSDADFGLRISPNPFWEDIGITIANPTGGIISLTGAHIDTICVPEPATILLLTLGGLILRRKR